MNYKPEEISEELIYIKKIELRYSQEETRRLSRILGYSIERSNSLEKEIQELEDAYNQHKRESENA